jgi:CDP-diacylglycerol--glycerol-3-phosphate 3-phosphatidyltransferase
VQLSTVAIVAIPIIVFAAFAVYCGLCAAGRTPQIAGIKHNQVLGRFLARFVLWSLSPLERLCASGRVSPNAITTVSLALCAASGVAAALGHLSLAAWVFTLGGVLDMLDGRLARAANRATPSGAMFDSVADRWADLAVFLGYAWYLRGSAWQLAPLLAIAGSTMVSYTRARAEALGIASGGGVAQRAERIFATVIGSLVASWWFEGAAAQAVVGATLLLVAVASTITALNRWRLAHVELVRREAALTPTTIPTLRLARATPDVRTDARVEPLR